MPAKDFAKEARELAQVRGCTVAEAAASLADAARSVHGTYVADLQSEFYAWQHNRPIRASSVHGTYAADMSYARYLWATTQVCSCFRPQGGGRWPLDGPCAVHGTDFDLSELPPEFEPTPLDVAVIPGPARRTVILWQRVSHGSYAVVALCLLTMVLLYLIGAFG